MERFRNKLAQAHYPNVIVNKRLKYSYDMRNQLMEVTPKSTVKRFSIPTTVNAHLQWNALQNNLEPLLKTTQVVLQPQAEDLYKIL
jgi:hypothetical protein